MHDHGEPVTLCVNHLPSATSFYLSALQPLGYRFLLQVSDPSGNSSPSIGLGPESCNRVDLYLAEAGRYDHGNAKTTSKKAHVVFPAVASNQVGEFYHCALNAGGRPVRAPDTLPRGDGLYSATVTDLDGNKVEVSYSAPEPVAGELTAIQELAPLPVDNQQDRSIGRWAEEVASTGRLVGSRRNSGSSSRGSGGPTHSAMPASARAYPTPSSPTYGSKTSTSSNRSRATSNAMPGKQSKASSIKSVDLSSKAVVGTLFGTATGAAIAYAVLTSHEDSRKREAEYNKKMQDRNLLEAEARSHRNSQEARLRSKSNSAQQKYTDRDSGYYSSASRKDDSPTRWRATTYPQAYTRSSRDIEDRQPRIASIHRSSTLPFENRYIEPAHSKAPSSRTVRAAPPVSSRAVTESRHEAHRPAKADPPPSYQSRQSHWSRREESERPRPTWDLPSSGNTVIGEDDDVSTVVPDDSISCAGSPPPRRRRRSSGGDRRRGGQGKWEACRRSVMVG